MGDNRGVTHIDRAAGRMSTASPVDIRRTSHSAASGGRREHPRRTGTSPARAVPLSASSQKARQLRWASTFRRSTATSESGTRRSRPPRASSPGRCATAHPSTSAPRTFSSSPLAPGSRSHWRRALQRPQSLDHGITEDELRGVALQAITTCGFPDRDRRPQVDRRGGGRKGTRVRRVRPRQVWGRSSRRRATPVRCGRMPRPGLDRGGP